VTDKQVTLAATQCVPHSMPEEADVFGDAFSLDAARAWSRERIDAHAAVLARAARGGESTPTPPCSPAPARRAQTSQ
jgi:hypothetical protein